MPTHQEIAGIKDHELVERMVSSHPERFDEGFWSFFDATVARHFDDTSTLMDIGCGPGLLLRDLRQRYPNTRLIGTDVTRAMIDYARRQAWDGELPAFHHHDITSGALPLEDGAADLVSMVAVLHVLPDPFVALREVRRVLSRDGAFLLQDWVRTPLPVYLDRMMPEDLDEDQRTVALGRFLALFSAHNKYTRDDWTWLLERAGFTIEHETELRSPHFRTFVCTAG